MEENKQCAACGAPGDNCEADFHQMLFWEAEYPEIWEVHHLMVLSYHLQHPHLYSVEGLENALGLLKDFVGEGQSPQFVRKKNAESVDSGNRKFKITARPDSIGVYAKKPLWTMTVRDVVAGDIVDYCDNVRAWAQSIYDAVQATK